MRLSRQLASLWGAVLTAGARPSAAQVYEENLPTDHPVIRYWRTDLDDPVTRLVKRFESRKLELDFHGEQLSFLPSLFEHLGVSADSQVLAFSKSIPSRDEPKLSPIKRAAGGSFATPLERTPAGCRRETSRAPAPTYRPQSGLFAAMPNQPPSHGGYRVPFAGARDPLARAR